MDDLFPTEEEVGVKTRFGRVMLYHCRSGRREFIFLPRHRADHSVPPHRINFKANLQALKDLGVERVVATSAVSSISEKLPVGGLGLLDQFIDLSKRHLTYFDLRPVHVDMTRPYDSGLQLTVVESAAALGVKLATGLVYASVDGPRYETSAEIRMLGLLGADVVGMTGAPEAILAKELGLRYASIVVGTNRAAGLQDRISHGEVVEMMSRTSPLVRGLLERTVESA